MRATSPRVPRREHPRDPLLQPIQQRGLHHYHARLHRLISACGLPRTRADLGEQGPLRVRVAREEGRELSAGRHRVHSLPIEDVVRRSHVPPAGRINPVAVRSRDREIRGRGHRAIRARSAQAQDGRHPQLCLAAIERDHAKAPDPLIRLPRRAARGDAVAAAQATNMQLAFGERARRGHPPAEELRRGQEAEEPIIIPSGGEPRERQSRPGLVPGGEAVHRILERTDAAVRVPPAAVRTVVRLERGRGAGHQAALGQHANGQPDRKNEAGGMILDRARVYVLLRRPCVPHATGISTPRQDGVVADGEGIEQRRHGDRWLSRRARPSI